MLSILARNVHIEFPIYDHRARSLKHTLAIKHLAKGFDRLAAGNLNVGGKIGTGETGRVVIKALDGVSFEIHEGDRVGLLGHNGSGKTTLLRAIAGIYEPATGMIKVQGRAVPMFDLQLGMDPDATGIENIWTRGKMLGLSNKQIGDVLSDIGDFTELGEYLYMPTRTYSSGMALRLAFGISTAITPEILLLDEIISAGDAAFIAKADHRLKEFLARTGLLVIASHSMGTLRQWCNKAMMLEQGKLIAFGAFEEVVSLYESKVTA
jgi:ABC-2 type transport system ATP-binding protein